tara:strand:+ start:237 stop:431 length:195 start_codon:yes stop_codon:yes gene_type:complete
MRLYVGLFIGWAFTASVFTYFDKPKEPAIFDSMLCSVHTPVGAILVNDELIKASNGKIYRWIEE